MVDSSTRGTGLGKMMVNRLTDMAIASGCYKILLNCVAACKGAPQTPCSGLHRTAWGCAVLGAPCVQGGRDASGHSRMPFRGCAFTTQARRRTSVSTRSAGMKSRRSPCPSTWTTRRGAAVWGCCVGITGPVAHAAHQQPALTRAASTTSFQTERARVQFVRSLCGSHLFGAQVCKPPHSRFGHGHDRTAIGV